MKISADDIDAGFEQLRAERALQKRIGDARRVEFWRELNPHLSISDFPLQGAPRRTIDPTVARTCREQLLRDGYMATPSLLPREELNALALGIQRVVDIGLTSTMAAVYDEYYRVFAGLEDLLEPLLGADYLLVTDGLWAFYVPAGDSGRMLWSANDPHRDAVAPDLRTMAGDVPSILTLWLALGDVTPEHSCIYVVPADADPDFYSGTRRVDPEHVRLQDIRALPVSAGSIIGWSGHLAHWGSASSPFVKTPRIAVTMYAQRRDVPAWRPFMVRPDAPASFEDRLLWIERSMARPGLLTGKALTA